MQTTRETLEHIRPLFTPGSQQAIDIAITDAIRSAGSLQQLGEAVQAYPFHPDFESVSQSQITGLEGASDENLAHFTSLQNGPVDQHIRALCRAHNQDYDSLKLTLDADEGTQITPTFFLNPYAGRLMLTGHLTVIQVAEVFDHPLGSYATL